MSRTKIKSRRIADFPRAYRECLAHWSVLRLLGFEAADIFFGFQQVDADRDCTCIQLQTQGTKFTMKGSRLPGSPHESVMKTWQRLIEVVQKSSVDERTANYRSFYTEDRFKDLVMSLTLKGILIPEAMPLFAAGQA